jgi:hypothetical protein
LLIHLWQVLLNHSRGCERKIYVWNFHLNWNPWNDNFKALSILGGKHFISQFVQRSSWSLAFGLKGSYFIKLCFILVLTIASIEDCIIELHNRTIHMFQELLNNLGNQSVYANLASIDVYTIKVFYQMCMKRLK